MENVCLKQTTKTKQWLNGIFPEVSGDFRGQPESYQWSSANEERHLSDTPLSGRSLSLRARIGRPLQICVHESGPLVVLVIATEDCRIHVLMTSKNIFTPVWQDTKAPFEDLMQYIESLLILDGNKHASISRLAFVGSDLYCFHGHGVAVLDIDWIKSLRRAGKALSLARIIAMRPTRCRHIIISSDNLIGAALMVHGGKLSFGAIVCPFLSSSVNAPIFLIFPVAYS